MPKVMQAGLIPAAVRALHAGAPTQSIKRVLGSASGEGLAGAGREERGFGPARWRLALSGRVGAQGERQLRAERHQARFVKLTGVNGEHPAAKVDVRPGERQRLADA